MNIADRRLGRQDHGPGGVRVHALDVDLDGRVCFGGDRLNRPDRRHARREAT
jgi:hypothetical protein